MNVLLGEVGAKRRDGEKVEVKMKIAREGSPRFICGFSLTVSLLQQVKKTLYGI